jgi:hypothetical protein
MVSSELSLIAYSIPMKIRDVSGTLFGKWNRWGFRENFWGSGQKEAVQTAEYFGARCGRSIWRF